MGRLRTSERQHHKQQHRLPTSPPSDCPSSTGLANQAPKHFSFAAVAVAFMSAAFLYPKQAIANQAPLQLAQTQLAQSVGMPTLTADSTGDAVIQLQGMLKLLGFYQGAIDGIYSPSTQTAVSEFQSAAGILSDGITGPGTWQKLLPQPGEVQTVATQPESLDPTPEPAAEPAETGPTGPPILRPGAEGSAVAQLQRELQELGYYDGEIDGGYGEQTQAAVEAFQSDQQLTVDAIVGPSTWDALSRALDS